jgi:arylmalonate decarboxylase
MRSDITVGLVVPFAKDELPYECAIMYPGVTFIPRGVGVRALTPEGYAAAFDAIIPAADELAAKDVDAIMVIGTSLTFYRGPQAHDELLMKLRQRTGLPVSTMSQAIIDGLGEVGAKRVAVATPTSSIDASRNFLRRRISTCWRSSASISWNSAAREKRVRPTSWP